VSANPAPAPTNNTTAPNMLMITFILLSTYKALPFSFSPQWQRLLVPLLLNILTSRMLEHYTPLEVISDILGLDGKTTYSKKLVLQRSPRSI